MKNSYSLLTKFAAFALIAVGFLGFADKAFANIDQKPATLASLLVIQQPKAEDKRAEILKAYLERYNSPLAPHAQTFIDEADRNNLDWKWVVSIAGVESYFGQQIPPYSYNAWGYGVYGNNVRRFTSWDDGIATVTNALRDDYLDKWGATNLYEIGSFYAADERWANKVTHFYTDLETFESKQQKKSLSISL